jgi:hypothetical protein
MLADVESSERAMVNDTSRQMHHATHQQEAVQIRAM